MPHYVLGLLDILTAALFIFFSYRLFKKNNFQFSAFSLVAAAFILRAFVASDLYLHEWDERYHALVAKNLMDNFLVPKLYPNPLLPYNFTDWSSNYIWLHKQPLPLWCMAISMKIFGINEWALRFPSVCISSIGVYLTYFIAKNLFNEKVGLLAAFFHCINGLMIEMTGGRIATDHIDVFFFFFVELGIALSIVFATGKKMYLNVIIGISVGLAVLSKWLPAFIVALVWLILNYERKALARTAVGLSLVIISSLAVFIPWQLYAHATFPLEYASEMLHNYRHIVEELDGRGGGVFYFFNKLFITLNEFIWMALVWFIFKAFQDDNTRNRFALIMWIIIPFVFFSIAKTKMQGYLLFVYPALFIVLAEFCVFLLEQNTNEIRLKFQKAIFAVIIFLAGRYSIERIKPFQDQSKDLVWANEFRKMESQHPGKRVYVNVKHCIEGMFYTNYIIYGYTPTSEQMNEMKAKGYEVIVNQNPEL